MTTCEKCGVAYETPDWPFCPHGKTSLSVVADDIPGGLWVENLGKDPVKVYSHSERRRIAAANGVEECVKWSGPGDHHVPRWSTMDPQTLENARILVSRAARQTVDAPVVCESLEITVQEWPA